MSVRADPEARAHILRSSGINAVVFAREHPSSEGGLEYVPVWVYTQSGKPSNPLGVARACASAVRHWGLCKSSKSVGVRAAKEDLEKTRTWLRPDDGSLVGENKALVPTKKWVLKNVQAKATREELTRAVCTRWAILPVRILGQKKERATWLIESEVDPPSEILQAGEDLIFVQSFQQKKPQPRHQGRNKSRTPAKKERVDQAEQRDEGARRVTWNEPGTSSEPSQACFRECEDALSEQEV